MAPTTIPVVDFASWSSDQSHRQRVAQDIVAACKQVGFVYIVNHSLPETLLEDAFRWSRLLFDLPETEKRKAPHPEGWAVHRGYSWPGLEKVSQAMSEKNDQERAGQLREIPDVKVKIPFHMGVSHAIFEATVSRLFVGSACDTY
jgi:isopenicillin N synthase-like dioxygenase